MSAKQFCKRTAVILGLVAGTFFATGPARADDGLDVDLRGGVYTDADAPALGGGLLMSMGAASGWYFNPNVEFVFKDNDTDASINGDFHYDFPTASSISPYVGAGPALLVNEGDDDFGMNVLGGVAGKTGSVRPFAQVKGVFGGGNEFAVMGGLRF